MIFAQFSYNPINVTNTKTLCVQRYRLGDVGGHHVDGSTSGLAGSPS